jgi:hypothetical protein
MSLKGLNIRRSLSYVLLATYASFSFLGEGLHLFVPHCGHHHGVFVCTLDDELHADRDSHTVNEVAAVADPVCESHLCEVCAFLSQLHSPPAPVTAAIDWQPICVDLELSPPSHYSSAALSPHAPRGPPAFIG